MTIAKSRSKSMALAIATTVVALAGASGTGITAAAQPEDALSRKVAYGDLNLESQQGAKELYARLRFAAGQVCLPLDSKEPSRKSAWQTCIGNALESSVAQINSPLVSALYTQSVSRSSKGKS